jgi:hypothetical protein
MPGWMRAGFEEYGLKIDVKMSIDFPVTKGSIKGKLTGGKSGRGGRANVGVFDEFAHIEDAPEVIKASSSLAWCKIFVSTVRGMNNAFARITHSPGAILFKYAGDVGFHWRNHMFKDEKWAIVERSRPEYTDEIWAQEQEIQYETSTSGRVYSKIKNYANNPFEWCHFREGSYAEYDPNYQVMVGIDFGISDPNAIVFAQIKNEHEDFTGTVFGNCLVIFEELEQRNQSVLELAEYLLSKPYSYKYFVGDLRTAQNRDRITKMTIIDYMRRHGIEIVGKRNSAKAPIIEVMRRIEAPGCFLVNTTACPRLKEGLQQWSYPISPDTGLPRPKSLPLDNKYSHLNKALAYLCDYLFGNERHNLAVDSSQTWDFNMMHTRRKKLAYKKNYSAHPMLR